MNREYAMLVSWYFAQEFLFAQYQTSPAVRDNSAIAIA